MSRYRVRTWLRGNLPGVVSWLVPKGRRGCGEHDWYRSDAGTWRCYHCPATRPVVPVGWNRFLPLSYAWRVGGAQTVVGIVGARLRWALRWRR